METLEIRIEPLDPLLFGDNRSARAGEDHGQVDQDPSPATFYGAIGARIASQLGAFEPGSDWSRAEPVLGAFTQALDSGHEDRSQLLGVAYRDPEDELWFPKPAHLRLETLDDRLVGGHLLLPADSGDLLLSSLPARCRRLTLAGDERRRSPREVEEAEEPLLVHRDLLASVLAEPWSCELGADALRTEVRKTDRFHVPDRRLGLAMSNATNTAQEGRLFSRPYRRFTAAFTPGGFGSAGFIAWYRVRELGAHTPADWSGLGHLGGDRRRVRLAFTRAQERPVGDLLARVLDQAPESRGFSVCLLTPAVATEPIPCLGGRRPIAAALGRPRHASGWCAAGPHHGPRPIRTLVPAGSVLFFEWGAGEAAPEARRKLLEALWLEPLDPAYRNHGFGRMLTGVWR
jgi:hypothetical protein